MGFGSWLKKKISIKNVVKVVKSTVRLAVNEHQLESAVEKRAALDVGLPYITGDYVGAAQGAAGIAGSALAPNPRPHPATVPPPQGAIANKNNTVLIVAIGVVVFLLIAGRK